MAEIKKIAIIAPPFTTVPPMGHGGIERIVYSKIKELAKRGYDVEVFGCGKFEIPVKFHQIFPQTIAEMKFDPDLVEASRPLRLEVAYLAAVMGILNRTDGQYDIVFNHSRGGYLFMPLFEKLKTPILSTFHLPLFTELDLALKNLKETNFISISNHQRQNAPHLKYAATIYNGIDLDEFEYNKNPRDYFLFLGALGKHKGLHLAIKVAQKTNQKLIIAGGKKREPFFSRKIAPKIDGQQITLVGEVDGQEKIDLYKNAQALLFPTLIDEAFGLVMIEAMACGTPVISLDNGAVREVIDDGRTGFICRNVEEMAQAVGKINRIRRSDCRKLVEEKFTAKRMVDNYLKTAEKAIQNKRKNA